MALPFGKTIKTRHFTVLKFSKSLSKKEVASLREDIPAQLVMESGKVSGEINYSMGTDAAVQNVSIEALQACGEKNLWKLYKYDMTEINND